MIETAIGFSGMLLILTAFFMNQTKRWSSEDLAYDAVNAAGGLLLVFYAFLINSYPFLILNALWAYLSIKDVFTDLRRNRK
jgi:hypothetical protein